ncbi:MAG: DUF2510 domain-containing protein [Acidimicrobiia bacterium]
MVLAFLSPFVAEGLTGNTPPFLFWPFVVLLMVFYGSGAVLIREVSRAWNKGWPTVLALGAAYGICEEGFATKVFFAPPPSGHAEMQYGTWAGVHWPFAVAMIVFHAVFSIALPILLTELNFPGARSRPWIRPRLIPVVGGVFALAVVFSATVIHRYDPGSARYLIAFAVVVLLVGIGRVLPRSLGGDTSSWSIAPRRLGIYGFVGTMAFWVVSYLYAGWKQPVGVAIASQLLILAVSVRYLRRLPGDDPRRFALAAGMLGFFVFTSFLLAPFSPLQPFVGAVTWYALVRLGRTVRARAGAPDGAPETRRSRVAPPAGVSPARWAADPSGRHQYRWWDGSRWTEHVADDGRPGVDPSG